jgi:uncharacterized coiled-coil DUF342 family protein
MSESRGNATPADLKRERDEIAAELYVLRPDAFTAARDEQVHKARAGGRGALARELNQLRRPTQSAWLVNLLWRDQRSSVQELLRLGDDLRRAQAKGSAGDLHRLTARRRELETTLIGRAHALAEKAGVDFTAATEREVQATLSAAVAEPEVANEVRTGRMVKPAAYAGFGVPVLSVMPSETGRRSDAVDTRRKIPASSQRQATDSEGRAGQRARERREEAGRRIEKARATLEAAAAALAETRGAAEGAQQRYEEVHEQVEQLREQLRDLEKKEAVARRAALTADRRRDEAKRTSEAATRSLERAEQQHQA